jgi:hypothetical protein
MSPWFWCVTSFFFCQWTLPENATPRVAAKFYKAVVQAVLLYGSKMWNLTKAVLARLEGFHVQAVYCMAQVHRPRQVAGN